MGSNKEMIEAFVTGRLSEADHDLMAHHISTCQECAAAVAAERVVRMEMVKLTAGADASPPPSALVPEPSEPDPLRVFPADTHLPSVGQATAIGPTPVSGAPNLVAQSVVESADLSVPLVPELQLDFVLDRTSEGDGMLLPREEVREVALDQLPPAPAHSERRSYRESDEQEANTAVETAGVAYADDTEVAAATAAGVADSVAHAAAALASGSPWDELEPDPEPAPPVIVEELEPPVVEELTIPEAPSAGDVAVEAEAQRLPLESEVPVELAVSATVEGPPVGNDTEPPVARTVAVTGPQSETAAAGGKPSVQESALAAPAAVPRSSRIWRWSTAAALLVTAVVAAYAATQVRSSTTVDAAAAPDRPPTLGLPEVARDAPSVLTAILDSAVFGRVVDVTVPGDFPSDSLNAGIVSDPSATPRSGAAARTRSTPRARIPRVRQPLPQVVSDPRVADTAPVRPRLLRTTTHRPRRDVVYVLREYDAPTAEPYPRAGVNEYRWRDATGSRLYVLSGPVGVTELRAYALWLQASTR